MTNEEFVKPRLFSHEDHTVAEITPTATSADLRPKFLAAPRGRPDHNRQAG